MRREGRLVGVGAWRKGGEGVQLTDLVTAELFADAGGQLLIYGCGAGVCWGTRQGEEHALQAGELDREPEAHFVVPLGVREGLLEAEAVDGERGEEGGFPQDAGDLSEGKGRPVLRQHDPGQSLLEDGIVFPEVECVVFDFELIHEGGAVRGPSRGSRVAVLLALHADHGGGWCVPYVHDEAVVELKFLGAGVEPVV